MLLLLALTCDACQCDRMSPQTHILNNLCSEVHVLPESKRERAHVAYEEWSDSENAF
jgi:hypothetical protein